MGNTGEEKMANGSSPCREHHEQGKVSPARDGLKTSPAREHEEGLKTSPAVSALGIPVSFPPRRGGWRTAPYIFGAGAIDFLASIGIMINMLAYLKGRLGLTTVEAANTITNFMGMCSYTPLVGAFIADAYIGRYKTILIASIIYVLGLVVLVMETKLPSTKSPNCKKDECLGYLYAGFVLIAVAAGGIRPNAPAFGADQFDQKDPVERQQLYGYFNWYYFFIVVAVMTSSTLLVYIQNTVGWFWGFGVPAMSMLAAVALFWAGSPLYRRMVPLGSPFTRLAQVVTAAFRKRKLTLPEDPNTLYSTKCVDHDKLNLSHTMQYRFLDKAAIVTPDDFGSDEKTQADAWRLCDVNQVEELKSLLRMAPVWSTGIPIFIAWSQQTTFWLAEGYKTNLKLGKFNVPAGSLPVFSNITMLLFLPVYDRLLVPLAKRMTKNPRGITFLQRIGIGIMFAALSMVTAGLIAVKRRNHHSHPAMSCFWMVPQFCLLGLSEAFVVIGYLEFFYDQSPPSMRSMAAAVVWAIVGTGNYCSSLVVLAIKKWTSKAHGVRDGWLADNPNQGHFEYFYWLLAVLLAADFIAHLLVSGSYKYTKPDYSAGGGVNEEDEKVPVMF